MRAAECLDDVEPLLDHLKRTRGFDLSSYRRASLSRRVHLRLRAVGASGCEEYIAYLGLHPDELEALLDTIRINVTRFFRDEAAWAFLASQVIPELLSRRGAAVPLRVWSAGCASGEEAYTLAMLLAEQIGDASLRERVEIYATDVDENALAVGRLGCYGMRQVANVPPAFVARYFERTGTGYVVGRRLRRPVIFGRHDLVQNAPLPEVDLLVCRNTLMYFDADMQRRILRDFHFALADAGVLFLGAAERLLPQASAFRPIDRRRRFAMKLRREHGAMRGHA